MNCDKKEVHDFWNRAACGEELYLPDVDQAGYAAQADARYKLEPHILDFARFSETRGLRLLEIGVGLGAEHQRFAQAGADLSGVDLTERAVDLTRKRLASFGLSSDLAVGDAEALNFSDKTFDGVYSYGVLHHSPDTQKAIHEVWRVLKPDGYAKIMIYHKWSMDGLMLWVRYGLLRLRPWMTMTQIYARYLESPGTKAYSEREAFKLFSAFSEVRIRTLLGHGDLLESAAGQRHRGWLLTLARKIWPRKMIRYFLPWAGLFMLIEAQK